MANKWLAKCKYALGEVRDFLDEKALASVNRAPLSRLQSFAHLCLLIWKSFSRNRCLIHASALAYTSLLALIPMLFVVISLSSTFLQKEDGRRVSHFIDQIVASITPPSAVSSNAPPADVTETDDEDTMAATLPTNRVALVATNDVGNTSEKINKAIDPKTSVAGREELVRSINGFITNIQKQSGALGVTGATLLVFMAISMLRSIENTFNDIWGVPHGRGWVAQIMQYSALLFLGPLLLGVALGLASGPHLDHTRALLQSMPVISHLLFQIAPVILLCVAFAIFYMLIPNTHVHWDAAFVGGIVGGILWHLNNYFSVLYVSRWVTNSKIYGSLAIIPVFMVGLYFSWLIVLFGAQVAYAYQNRAAYQQEKQAENINQRGREFVALRLMECIGQRFQRGWVPASAAQIAEGLSVPTRLVQKLMQTLIAAHLVVEIAGEEPAFAPARPLETITCHDILLALRAGKGQELTTRDEPARAEVFGEFEKILEAEKKAASGVTVLTMVNRTEKLAAATSQPIKAVENVKPGNS